MGARGAESRGVKIVEIRVILVDMRFVGELGW